MKNRLLVYFKKTKLTDRWFIGDRYLRKIFDFFKNKNKSSLEMVFLNLCKAFDELNLPYSKNLPFNKIRIDDKIIVLGLGKKSLQYYNKSNKLIAGIGLMNHPSEWPSLFSDYPIEKYLQHSTWTANIYNRWYGQGSCEIWQAGIDTEFWKPDKNKITEHVLIYEKFLWNKEENRVTLLHPILKTLETNHVKYKIITYGSYQLKEYKQLLNKSFGMIFLCEHESQGLAYQEAMAMNVPILAWDQGFWLDPNRFKWGETEPIPATSVPYFDENCGIKFKDLASFMEVFQIFHQNANDNKFKPRQYVLENLTLEKSAERMLDIINQVYK